jgi:hypothetical protein
MIFKKGFGRNGVSSNRSLASKGAAKKRNGQQGFHFLRNFFAGSEFDPQGSLFRLLGWNNKLAHEK